MEQYFATVGRGLEAIAAAELSQLGAQGVEPGFCGVAFQGDRPLLYRVNLWARIPFRILWQIHTFARGAGQGLDGKQLYGEIQTVDWSRYLSPDQTFAVRATGGNDRLNHTHYTALQVKNAIVDQQRQQFGQRSSVDLETPDLAVNLHIDKAGAVLSLDSSGASLHRRGYRPAMGAAPLKETLAAALIDMTDWQPSLAFFDPLCGSGTLPIEAALKSLRVAPGIFQRSFGFQQWQDFDADLWDGLVRSAENQEQSQLPGLVVGSDRDGQVLRLARHNAQHCGIGEDIQLLQQDFSQIEPPADQGVILCNPPYGERLGAQADLGAFYKQMGDVFKQRFKNWTAYVLCGNLQLAKGIGLRSAQRLVVYNGNLECRLLKFELY